SGPGPGGLPYRSQQRFVAVEHPVPGVALLDVATPGLPEALPEDGIAEEQVDGGAELGIAPVGDPAAASPALAGQHVAVALHQRRLGVGPGLGEDHREALEI